MFNNLSILLISLGEIPYFSELVYQISLQYHGVQSCLSKTSRSVRKFIGYAVNTSLLSCMWHGILRILGVLIKVCA